MSLKAFFRKTETESERPTEQPATTDEQSSGSTLGRKILLGGTALIAVAYVASRRAGSGGSLPSPDEVRERVGGDELGKVIPIGGSTEMESEVDADEAKRSGDEMPDTERMDEEIPETGRAAEELEERGEEDIRTESPEPGEMNVEQEAVEEVVDEENKESVAETESGSDDWDEANEDEE